MKEKLLKGYKAGDKTFKVHLDGYNLLPAFKGEAKEWPRKEFFYFERRRRTDGAAVRPTGRSSSWSSARRAWRCGSSRS